MIFIDNKYTKTYFNIIIRAKSRILTGYTEKHHIIPECFYIESKRGSTIGTLSGNPDDVSNLVELTAREHSSKPEKMAW